VRPTKAECKIGHTGISIKSITSSVSYLRVVCYKGKRKAKNKEEGREIIYQTLSFLKLEHTAVFHSRQRHFIAIYFGGGEIFSQLLSSFLLRGHFVRIPWYQKLILKVRCIEKKQQKETKKNKQTMNLGVYCCKLICLISTWWPNRGRVSRSRIGSTRTTTIKRGARVVLGSHVSGRRS